MEASTSQDDVKTFRGRTLEELLPQIRAELGPDAIVLRRREGRDKKAGGFFQRPFVEVDARAPRAEERSLEIRSDRATAEGLSSPAVQALFEQATPFADALAAAARDSRMQDDTFSASFSPDTTDFSAVTPEPEAPRRMRDRTSPPDPPAPAGLYGPQPNAAAIEDATPKPAAEPPAPEAATAADGARAGESPFADALRAATAEPPVDAPPSAITEPPLAAGPQAAAPPVDSSLNATEPPLAPAAPPSAMTEPPLAAGPQAAAPPPPDASRNATEPPLASAAPPVDAPRTAAAAPPPAASPVAAATAPPPARAAAPSPAAPSPAADGVAPGLDIKPAPVPTPQPAVVPRPPSADAAEERLVASGLSPALAADVVGEAVVHGLPFSAPRNMKRLVRTALARRIPTPTAVGPGPRTIAIVGGGGAGKSSAIAHLAASYAAAGAEVAVIELRGNGTLAHRLQPLGVGVISAADAEQATERLGARQPLITLIDTPATGPSAKAADVKALAADLRALGAEVHMALPATISAAAAGEVAAALAPLNPSHVALTHTDETSRPGAPLELALSAGRPVSYVCSRDGASPADPGALATQLLP